MLTVPFALAYLGDAQFGLWMTFVSFTAMGAFADLGIGNGLLTRMSEALAQEDLLRARAYLAAAYRILAMTAGVVVAVATAVVVLAGGRISAALAPDVDPRTGATMLLIVSAFFALQLPIGVVVRVQYALQEVASSNAWAAVGGGLALLGVIITTSLDAGVVAMVLAYAAGPALSGLLNTAWTFGRRHTDLRPAWRHGLPGAGRELLAMGGLFFAISLMSSIALNIDNTLVSMTRGSVAVAEYTVVARAFALLGLAVTLVTLPMWPALAEAIARGDRAWATRAVRRVQLLLAIIVTPAAALLVTLRNPLISLWIGQPIDVPLALAAGFGAWSVLLALASPWFMIQNSVGRVRLQVAGWVVFLVVSVGGKLVHLTSGDVAYLPWIASAVYAAVMLPVAYLGSVRILKVLPATDTTEH